MHPRVNEGSGRIYPPVGQSSITSAGSAGLVGKVEMAAERSGARLCDGEGVADGLNKLPYRDFRKFMMVWTRGLHAISPSAAFE